MTDRSPGSEPDDVEGRETAPVDFDRLDLVADRLRGDARFVAVELRPEFAPDRLTCRYDPGLYPHTVVGANLDVVWYENGDFSIHYHESHESGSFDHRWDRHPSDHNARDHVHPGPEAPTPGGDASHPPDWRDVLSTVLREVEERQRSFWTE